MPGMLLVCNPIALFCSEWSLVVIIPHPTSFVPPHLLLKCHSPAEDGQAYTYHSLLSLLAFHKYIPGLCSGLWPNSHPAHGGRNSFSAGRVSKAWHCLTLASSAPGEVRKLKDAAHIR